MSTPTTNHPVFQRVQEAYDLDFLRKCRFIVVGVGGAREFVENVVRTGVGEVVLVDPDEVDVCNVGTQQVYLSEVGRLKVDCLAEKLKDINPNIRLLTLPKAQEEIDDADWSKLIHEPLEWPGSRTNIPRSKAPARTLLCGLTDNFEAQARINRLALQFGVPSLCAQLYREGRGGEVTFTFPGVTPACHRCMLNSRYQAHLENGFANDVTSNGTPIFATDRLNALKGFLTLALLHHGTDHPRWGSLLRRIGNRNFVQIRMDPDLGATLGLGLFDRVLGQSPESSVFFDETLWRAQLPDNPINGYAHCPDCGGTGDLCDALGTFTDTLSMRHNATNSDASISGNNVKTRPDADNSPFCSFNRVITYLGGLT